MASEPRPGGGRWRVWGLGPWLLGAGCAVPTSLGALSAQSSSTSASSSTSGSGTASASGSNASEGVTIGVTSGATSESSTGSPSTGTDMVGPQPMHAWVMRYDDWSDAAPGDGGTTDSGGSDTGTEVSPDTLVVQISTGPGDCEDPWAGLECGEQWQIFMLIPPELQVPGTYVLFDDFDAFYSATGRPEPDGQCSGGGATLEGQAELSVVSEQEVSGQLSMTLVGDFDADVSFTALGCG